MARILCIEDDADIQHIIGQVLFKEGYEVFYAWNGQEGYEKILSLNLDLILLDLITPVMNGVELLKKLQDNKATLKIPVIIVTSCGDEANILKDAVETLGAAYYLRKPIDLKELTGSVRRVLAQFPRKPDDPAVPEPKQLSKGAVRADPKLLTVWVNDRLVATLSYKEFALLQSLMKSSGPVSKEELLRDLGYEATQSNALKQIFHRLREGLGPAESGRVKTSHDGFELIG